MGEQFLKRLADGFKARGDKSVKALAAPTLLGRNKPEILATDFAISPNGDANLQPGDRLHLENVPSGIRVLKANREVCMVDVPAPIREAVAARGVAAAVVHECSAFGGVSIRIREEDHVP